MASIRLENVSFSYPIFSSDCRSLKQEVLNKKLFSSGGYRIEAIKDLNIEAINGDRVGLIGANGAGKSSLLKLLAGVYAPEVGTIHIEGRVSALFNARLGMDPNANGIENIYIAGLVLGLTKRRIKDKLEEIICFADLGEFIHMPVRTYSQGMVTRLAFSVATAIDPEILLLDEWIGAFDRKFNKKAIDRMNAFTQQTRILILASHNLNLISSACNKLIVLNNGNLEYSGPIKEGLEYYYSQTNEAQG